jgi:hypothetical protein
MSVEFEWDEKKWQEFTKKIIKQLSDDKIDSILQATAYRGLKHIVSSMPKRTGALGRSWYVDKRKKSEYLISTTSKVALFLEDGTKAHGPKVKKFLYIPLRPGAATWRKGFVFGKDFILVKRVKGIKARKYLKPISKEILGMMISEFSNHLESI